MGSNENSENGLRIRLVAAYCGLKGIAPPFAIGGNNLNPKLILYQDYLEYKSLFRTHTKRYEQIEEVDIYLNSFKILSVATTSVCFRFEDSIFTFVGNLNNVEKLKELLRFLQMKNCWLTDNAEALLA